MVQYILVWGRISADYYNYTFDGIQTHNDQMNSCYDIPFPMNRRKLKSTNDNHFYNIYAYALLSILRLVCFDYLN